VTHCAALRHLLAPVPMTERTDSRHARRLGKDEDLDRISWYGGALVAGVGSRP
jgi:hypothetical protein